MKRTLLTFILLSGFATEARTETRKTPPEIIFFEGRTFSVIPSPGQNGYLLTEVVTGQKYAPTEKLLGAAIYLALPSIGLNLVLQNLAQANYASATIEAALSLALIYKGLQTCRSCFDRTPLLRDETGAPLQVVDIHRTDDGRVQNIVLKASNRPGTFTLKAFLTSQKCARPLLSLVSNSAAMP
jgi:hypothetical protein